ncbi:Mu transposase C-terminal domain-containing protein [Kitasatospora herbaricolor]|uniref:Mu transposase C-terminal domain-containing protein n=1 Tax=Kitasatospora herbaricolor TaxID=68217 RepID=UPI0036DAE13D
MPLLSRSFAVLLTLLLMGRMSAEQRATTVARLEQLRKHGALTARHVHVVAEALGVTERTVWRWLAGSDRAAPRNRRTRPRYELTDTDRAAFAHFRGNVLAVARARTAVVCGDGTTAGTKVPDFLADGWANVRPVSQRTLYRAFEEDMTPSERAAWRTGDSGQRAVDVYLTRPQAPRGRVWEMDHKQLPLLVLPPKGGALSPWLTTVVDDGSRGLLGWALSVYPHAGTVLTAMRMALVHEPGLSPFGAVPERVRIDGGLEFAADAVQAALGALAVVVHRLPPYSPNRKGKVERLNRTIEQTLVSQLPGFTGGPRDASGRLYGPIGDSAKAKKAAEQAGGPMRIEEFVQRFSSWARWYNTERPHRALGGRAPAQAWLEDEAPLRRIDPARLRYLLLAGVERKVGKDGIRFKGHAYLAPELYGRGGEVLEVRYMPHEDRWIEVYRRGEYLCTAHPSAQLTPEQREAFREHARAEAERLGRERRRAARRARRELAPMTAAQGAAEPSRLVRPGEAAQAVQHAGEALLKARARADLLGIVPVTDLLPEL